MNKVMRAALACLCLALGSGPVMAGWMTTTEPGADGKGDIILLRGDAENGRVFQFMCRGEERSIAVITPDGSNHQPTGSETVDIGSDLGEGYTGPADYYRHSNGWLGLSYRNVADFEGIVRSLIASNTHFTADILDPGGDISKTIVVFAEATGSTKAGREFSERCYSTAPGFVPAGVTPAWSFSSNPGSALLVGDIGYGGMLSAICGANRQASLKIEFPDDDRYFPPTDGVGFALRIQIDQREVATTGAGFVTAAPRREVRFNDPSAVEGVIRGIASARGYVAVLGTADNWTSRWAALNVVGLTDAASRFIDACWGAGQPTPMAATTPPGESVIPAAAPVGASGTAWNTTIGPVGDGQGDAAIMLGEADEGRWIQLWCRGSQRRIAILVNDGLNDDPSGIIATMEFAADTGSTWRSEADFYRHDPNWLGLSYRNIGDMERIVQDIIGAQGNIAVSILPTDVGQAIYMTAQASGSTKAGRAFADFCFSQRPVAQPAVAAPVEPPPAAGTEATAPSQPAPPAAPASPVTGGVWVTSDLSADAASRYSAMMTAAAENAEATLRIACNPDSALLTFGISDRRGLAGDGAYDLTVSIDGQPLTLQRTVAERGADGTAWAVSTDARVLGLIDQLSVPKQVVEVEIVHAMGARRSYRFNAADAVVPATDMYFRCLAR